MTEMMNTMKKMLFTLALLPWFFGSLSAQSGEQFSDPGFDYWTTETAADGSTYDDLSDPFWTSLNNLASLPAEMFTGPVTMFKETGRSGDAEDYAPRLVSNQMAFGGSEQGIFLPGMVGTLFVDFNNITAVLGKPFTDRPDALRGYMKYVPVNGDSASIFIELTRYNADLGTRQVVGRGEQIFHEAVADWTEFNVPVEYRSGQQPDSITVMFVASAGYNMANFLACRGQLGSELWIDDVELVYGGSDPQANEANAALASSKLYPNPSADGRFNLELKEACDLQLISLSGQVLREERHVGAGLRAIDLSSYAPGFYFVRLSNAKGSAVLKAVVR